MSDRPDLERVNHYLRSLQDDICRAIEAVESEARFTEEQWSYAQGGGGRTRVIARGEWDDAWERWGIQDYVWSPCSRWVAYSMMGHNMNESIYLYSLDSGETTCASVLITTRPDGKVKRAKSSPRHSSSLPRCL